MRRGIFSIITTFFAVLLIMGVVLGFAGIGTFVFQLHTETGKAQLDATGVQDVKDGILLCHGGAVLQEVLLDAGECMDLGVAHRIEIVQEARFGCTTQQWAVGELTGDERERRVYWVDVVQRDSGATCLAKLMIWA